MDTWGGVEILRMFSELAGPGLSLGIIGLAAYRILMRDLPAPKAPELGPRLVRGEDPPGLVALVKHLGERLAALELAVEELTRGAEATGEQVAAIVDRLDQHAPEATEFHARWDERSESHGKALERIESKLDRQDRAS